MIHSLPCDLLLPLRLPHFTLLNPGLPTLIYRLPPRIRTPPSSRNPIRQPPLISVFNTMTRAIGIVVCCFAGLGRKGTTQSAEDIEVETGLEQRKSENHEVEKHKVE